MLGVFSFDILDIGTSFQSRYMYEQDATTIDTSSVLFSLSFGYLISFTRENFEYFE